jgi:Domain of unknown function (DUF4804)
MNTSYLYTDELKGLRNVMQPVKTIDNNQAAKNLDRLLKKSRDFLEEHPILQNQSPTAMNWLQACLDRGMKETALWNAAQDSYPIIHESGLQLLHEFRLHKLDAGTDTEKKIYEHLDLIGMVDRLLSKVTALH